MPEVKVAEEFSLEYVQVSSGTDSVPTATVGLRRGGALFQEASCGQNIMAAVFGAIDKVMGVDVEVTKCSADFVQNEPVKALVIIDHIDESITGNGESADIIEAIAMAYLDAVNKMPHNT